MFGWAALAVTLGFGAEAQTTIRVPLDYPTIHSAINAAANGDTLLVAPGTYVENINFSGKAITITSENGPEVTLIDGNQADSVVKFISGEGRSSVLSGFTVLNGRSGFDTPGFGYGGGIWIKNSSPTVTGNIISNNRACLGLGLSSEFGSPLIQRNTITNNRPIACSGGEGGGIRIINDATPLPRTEILDNVVVGNATGSGDGGGIWASQNVTIRGNIVSGNSATGSSSCGGGISTAGTATIIQNVITGNKAGCGGGIHLRNGASGQLVANNTIADNDSPSGSGILFESFVDGPPEPANNIVIGKAGQTAVHCLAYNGLGPPVLRFNNAYAPSGTAYGGICTDQTGINGNISADPLFVDQTGGNYRLQPASPSIDAGSNAVAQIPSRDLEGNARILDGNGDGSGIIDMGAYERAAILIPGSHDFGYANLGSAPASMTLSIANPFTTTLTVSSISIGNRTVGAGGASDFAVAPGGPEPCPSLAPILASGQSCTVLVTFTTSAIVGRKGATLRVVSDAPGSPTVAALFAEVVVGTSITSAPPERTVSSVATFTFNSNADGTTFECRVDMQGEFFPCTSPYLLGRPLGEHTLQVRAISKLGDRDPTPATYIWTIVPRAKRADFGGDGRSDILWRNTSIGENYVYPMNGTRILAGEGYLRTVADLDWKVAGVGDFDGDGKADILWRNSTTGQNYIYFMDGSTIKPSEGFIRTVPLAWTVTGIGDFDSDGKDDILWRNTVTGENYLYPMDGLSIKPSEGYLRTVADQSWQVAGIGDFDGDGKSDILWRNSASGQNYLYPMEGRAIKASEGFIRTVADLAWQVKGVGDFDGDGKADIVWRNSTSGENYLYPMDGTTIRSTEGYLRTVADLNWQIAAVGDYDGDGKSDLLWRNSSTGQNYLYPMDGTTIKPSEGFLRTVPVGDWTVVAK